MVTVFWMIIEPGSHYWTEREQLGLHVQAPGVPYVLEARGWPTEDLVAAAREIVEHRLGERFHLDGPRSLIEGVVPFERMITTPGA
jgi:hypothetical protein